MYRTSWYAYGVRHTWYHPAVLIKHVCMKPSWDNIGSLVFMCTCMSHFRLPDVIVTSQNCYRRTKAVLPVIWSFVCTGQWFLKCCWLYAQKLCYQEVKRVHVGDFSYYIFWYFMESALNWCSELYILLFLCPVCLKPPRRKNPDWR